MRSRREITFHHHLVRDPSRIQTPSLLLTVRPDYSPNVDFSSAGTKNLGLELAAMSEKPSPTCSPKTDVASRWEGSNPRQNAWRSPLPPVEELLYKNVRWFGLCRVGELDRPFPLLACTATTCGVALSHDSAQWVWKWDRGLGEHALTHKREGV